MLLIRRPKKNQYFIHLILINSFSFQKVLMNTFKMLLQHPLATENFVTILADQFDLLPLMFFQMLLHGEALATNRTGEIPVICNIMSLFLFASTEF